MDFRHVIPGGSPSSSSTTSSSSHTNGITNNPPTTTTTNSTNDPMQSWWESISKARSRIQLLSTLLPDPLSNSNSISSLADSDSPARALLSSLTAYSAVSTALTTSPNSGSGEDSLCNWLYDTFLSSDPDLRLVVLSFIPLVSGLYMSRVHSRAEVMTSLAGFEAVLLAVYASECRSRAGKAVVINIPDLSQPSLYHSPRVSNSNGNNNNKKKVGGGGGSVKVGPSLGSEGVRQSVGVLSMPLEPQTAIKSTKRATIVGVALDCYYKQISQMPTWSKVDFCRFAVDWAGQDCVCKSEFDERVEVVSFSFSDDDGIEAEGNVNVVEEMKNLEIEVGDSDNNNRNVVRGTRIMLPWELLQPILRILGHCLLGPLNTNDVKDAASLAVRSLYARGSHDLVPQAILATRSLIQLDKRAREAAAMAAASAANTAGSNANTPSKAKKPEILLVSK